MMNGRTIKENPQKDTLEVVCVCPFCGRQKEVELTMDQFTRWRAGASRQLVAPELSANDREALISGICDTCWNNMFGEEE